LIPLFLFASVKKEIIKFYKSHYPTIEIEKIISNKPFPKKYKNIDFKLANYKMPSSTLIIDGKYYFYRIKAKIKVYTADKVIRVNELILPNVSLKSINFRNFYSTPLIKIAPNLVASKIISKGAVINKSNTKIRPLILKGENVNVIFEDPNIEIFAKGKALSDGNLNDIIKVQINNKIYTGKVVGNGNVLIQ
jgi:flagella basal body P-ring formation protein FlgA